MKPIWGILMDAFFVAVLLWCSYTDLKSRTVSNLSVALLLCLGLVHTVLVVLSGSTWWVYPAGMLLGIPFFFAWLKGGMGGGDVKLTIVIGLYIGFWDTFVTFLFIFLVLVIILVSSRIINGTVKLRVPFVPVIVYGVACTKLLYLSRFIQGCGRLCVELIF